MHAHGEPWWPEEVGATGPARAAIVNDNGTTHWFNAEDDHQCLMNDPGTGFVEAWRCVNAPSEEWTVSGPPGGPVNFVNYWTHNCMAVSGFPLNGTSLTQVPCNAHDANQLWRMELMERGPVFVYYRFHALLDGEMCLDKPRGVNADGTHIQTWKCADQNHDPLDPFFDFNRQQWWYGV